MVRETERKKRKEEEVKKTEEAAKKREKGREFVSLKCSNGRGFCFDNKL